MSDHRDPSSPEPTLSSLKQGRLGRMAMLGRMAAGLAGTAVGAAGRWAVSSRDEAAEALHRKAAQRLLKSLGEMKGLPMKLGQITSYIDGAVPAEYQHLYDEALGQLRTRVAPMAWPAIQQVLHEELGPDAEHARFASFDTTPIAAASIGQVYRATLPDGRPVAVKIQYPGIREAIQSDLKNVQGLMKTMGAILPRVHVEQGVADLTARIEEECDYTEELANQERFRAIWEGDPEIIVPGTHPKLSTSRVLVTDFITAAGWEEATRDLDQEGLDRVGQIMFRFTFHSLYRYGLFNADPHPGNVLFLPDGRVAFLDFGCVQLFTDETLDAVREVRDLVIDHADDATLRDAIERDFQIPAGIFDDEVWAILVRCMRFCFEPLAAPQPFRFTRAYTAEIARMTMDAKMLAARKLLRTGIQEPRIQGFVFLVRIIFGLASILARLNAQGDWLAITRACEAVSAPEPRS